MNLCVITQIIILWIPAALHPWASVLSQQSARPELATGNQWRARPRARARAWSIFWCCQGGAHSCTPYGAWLQSLVAILQQRIGGGGRARARAWGRGPPGPTVPGSGFWAQALQNRLPRDASVFDVVFDLLDDVADLFPCLFRLVRWCCPHAPSQFPTFPSSFQHFWTYHVRGQSYWLEVFAQGIFTLVAATGRNQQNNTTKPTQKKPSHNKFGKVGIGQTSQLYVNNKSE